MRRLFSRKPRKFTKCIHCPLNYPFRAVFVGFLQDLTSSANWKHRRFSFGFYLGCYLLFSFGWFSELTGYVDNAEFAAYVFYLGLAINNYLSVHV